VTRKHAISLPISRASGILKPIAWTSVKTVDNHLMTVREKFKIDDTGICLSESYKRGLIKY
jgi:hypothetical protein